MANPNWIKIAGSGQGALPANPNNPTITLASAQDITNNKSGTGSIAKRVTVTVVPPNPVGTYSGVWIWLDHPDHSINPGTVAIDATDGTVPADGHTAAVGTFQPDQIGFFPYDPNNQQIVFDIDAPHVPELWRVYACPGSANSVQRPVEANKAGASPSYQFLANPPAPMASGVEYAPLVQNFALLAPGNNWSSNPNIEKSASGDQEFRFGTTFNWPTNDQNYQAVGGADIVLFDGFRYETLISMSNPSDTTFVSDRIPVPTGVRSYVAYAVTWDTLGRKNTIVPGVTPSVTFTVTRSTGGQGVEYTSIAASNGLPFVTINQTTMSDGSTPLVVTGNFAVPNLTLDNGQTVSDPSFAGCELKVLKPDGNIYTYGIQGRLTPITGTIPNPASAQQWAFFLVSVDQNGNRNSIAPMLAFSGGGGSGAVAVATVTNGVITGYTILNGGSGYTSAPTVTVNGFGSGASISATVTSGAVTSLTINAGGSGYAATPMVVATVGSGTGTGDMTKMNASTFSSEFQISSGAFRINQLSANTIVTGQLQVGGGGSKVSEMKIFDTLNGLIGWIGDDTGNSGYVGAWFKQVRLGGSSPASAIITSDSGGNTTVNGATVTLNSNGITSVISNANDTVVGQSIPVGMKISSNASPSQRCGISPGWIYLYPPSGSAYISMLTTQGAGGNDAQIFIQDSSGTKSINLVDGTVSANIVSCGELRTSGNNELIDTSSYFYFRAGTASTATGGSATLPANPVGFLLAKDASGSVVKIPYYS